MRERRIHPSVIQRTNRCRLGLERHIKRRRAPVTETDGFSGETPGEIRCYARLDAVIKADNDDLPLGQG